MTQNTSDRSWQVWESVGIHQHTQLKELLSVITFLISMKKVEYFKSYVLEILMIKEPYNLVEQENILVCNLKVCALS